MLPALRDSRISKSQVDAGEEWTREQLYFTGDEFFRAVIDSIEGASVSVEVEAYIFADDALGNQVTKCLCDAAGRGVAIRVIVDGIGSPGWRQIFAARFHAAGAKYQIHHEPPWERMLAGREIGSRRQSFRNFLRRLNTRNHRKLFVIDGKLAFLGGMNISDVHLESAHGADAWRDTGVLVEGEGLGVLRDSFELHWATLGSAVRNLIPLSRRGRRGLTHKNVLINSSRYHRNLNYRLLLGRINGSSDRLWIASAYFVPPGSLLRAIGRAAARGVDVKIIVPGKSDLFFMPFVALAFYSALLAAGVRIFEYQPRVTHAKTVIGDSWAIIGSSNMNHRSLLHDLEVDVVLRTEEAVRELLQQFERDLLECNEVRVAQLKKRSWWVRALGRIFLWLRVFL